ncbi:MAG: DUF4401 domain-containing protein [Rhodopirellula sp.]|nr:DUF4401 domain-containing protein [Rhodopirellula sp.]
MTEAPKDTDTTDVDGCLARDVLQLEATPRIIDRLSTVGILDSQSRLAAIRIVNGPVTWWPWIEKALLFLGLALTLSGVVCFFAWNWDELPGQARLAIIQGGIIACCGIAGLKKVETLAGKVAMTAAAALVGVFLAVFGQVYQTGADAYQLFAGWALLIFPWVLMCRLAGLWLLWLTIVNVAITLFWEQTIDPRGIDINWLALILGLLNGTAAAVREVLAQRGCKWLPVWLRRVLVPASLTALVVPGFVIVADLNDATAGAWCGLVVFLLSLALLYWQFRHRTPDLYVLTCGATAITVLSGAVVIRVVMEVGDEVFAFFLSGLAILGLVAVMTRWLIKTGRELRAAAVSAAGESDFRMDSTPVAVSDRQDDNESPALSVGELFSQLSAQGHLSEEDVLAASAVVNAEAQADGTPWFVQALIGFGAWLACLLFLGALAIAGLFDEGAAAMVIGVCLLGGGAFLDRSAEGAFLRQLGLAAGLTGLGVTGIGVAESFHARDLSSVTISLTLSTAVFYRAFRGEPFRFLSCLITVICITVWLCDESIFSHQLGRQTWVIHFLVLLETLGIGLIFARQNRSLFQPAGYAMAVGLLGTLLATQYAKGLQAWPSAVILGLAQLWILRRAWATNSNAGRQDFAIAAAGTALLSALSVPGVLASLNATLLGHLERNAVLKRLGILFLPVYIASFYYSLETTLLTKSLALIGSGLVQWAVRWYFVRHFNQTNLTTMETRP